jgi:hypothetical protein
MFREKNSSLSESDFCMPGRYFYIGKTFADQPVSEIDLHIVIAMYQE